ETPTFQRRPTSRLERSHTERCRAAEYPARPSLNRRAQGKLRCPKISDNLRDERRRNPIWRARTKSPFRAQREAWCAATVLPPRQRAAKLRQRVTWSSVQVSAKSP